MGAPGSLTGAEAQHPSYALLDQHNFTQVCSAMRSRLSYQMFCCPSGEVGDSMLARTW